MKPIDMKLAALCLCTLVGVTACPGPKPITGPKTVDLSITDVSPSSVYTAGGTTVAVTTTNGCVAADVTITIGSVPISATSIVSTGADNYSFPAPPAPAGTDQTNPTATTLTVTCAKPAAKNVKYGKSTATHAFTYDPGLQPAPYVKSYSPVGDQISVLAQMVVVFSEEMDASSITDSTVSIHGIPGHTTYDPATLTATFKPTQQLPYGTPQTCVVLGGQNGVHSSKGKTLATHLAPASGTVDPNQDSWTFTTRCEGCGNPWLGDISAAAGISTGGNYKLFSVTGAPTPVGTAYAGDEANHTYKLQSGFLYATQPPSGN